MKNLLNKVIFKKGNKKMRKTYKNICILCGKELIGNGALLFWTPEKIRQYKKDFKGEIRKYTIAGKEFKKERGNFVCLTGDKCIKQRKKQVK